MVPLKTVLLRLGDRIFDFLDTAQFELLKAMDAQMGKQEQLVKMVLDLHTEYELLRNKEHRSIILKRLELDEATMLADQLGISYTGHPTIELLKKSFRKGSEAEAILVSFFGASIPQPPIVDVPETQHEVQPVHGLYRHQRDALMKADAILEEHGRVMLHMPTGSGKTRTAMNLICKYLNVNQGKTVLWLAHSRELCEQAVEEFERAWKHLGDRPTVVRRFFGPHDWEPQPEGLLVAGLSKIWAYVKNSNAALYKQATGIGMVVFDEAHQSVAKTYQHPVDIILTVNPACKLLGLSATPGRTWNDISEDEKLAEMYLRQKVTLEVEGYDSAIDYLVSEKYLSNPEFHSEPYDGTHELSPKEKEELALGLDIPQGYLTKLSEDGLRNALVLNKVFELIRNGHQRILVFAINVRHAETLSSILAYFGVDSNCVTGESDPIHRSEVIARFKEVGGGVRVLCNYGVLTTGFDAPLTSAAIIARPTTSLVLFSQMVGRVIRGPKVGGTAEAEIWTVVDTNLPGFDSLVGAFTNWEDVW